MAWWDNLYLSEGTYVFVSLGIHSVDNDVGTGFASLVCFFCNFVAMWTFLIIYAIEDGRSHYLE